MGSNHGLSVEASGRMSTENNELAEEYDGRLALPVVLALIAILFVMVMFL